MSTPITRLKTHFIWAILVLLPTQLLWAKSSLDGSINVVNKRNVPVMISVDGDKLGTVGARSVRTFTAIPNGVRILRFQTQRKSNLRQSRAEQARVSVPISGRVSFTIVRRERRVTINNPNPKDMWLRVDKGRRQMIRAKSMTALPLTFGQHTLSIKPVGSSTNHEASLNIVVHRDAAPTVQLPQYFAELTIKSTNIARARVYIDGVKRGVFHRGATLTLRAIEPGRHRVELRQRNRTLASALLHFSSGQQHVWAVGAEKKANLKVINTRQRAIQFQINGRRPVTVAPHSHTFVRNLSVGYHEISYRGPRGRQRSDYVRVTREGGIFTIGVQRHGNQPARKR